MLLRNTVPLWLQYLPSLWYDTLVAGEQELNILAEILENSADVFEDLAKEIGSEDATGK
jgi:hypothetical protein